MNYDHIVDVSIKFLIVERARLISFTIHILFGLSKLYFQIIFRNGNSSLKGEIVLFDGIKYFHYRNLSWLRTEYIFFTEYKQEIYF